MSFCLSLTLFFYGFGQMFMKKCSVSHSIRETQTKAMKNITSPHDTDTHHKNLKQLLLAWIWVKRTLINHFMENNRYFFKKTKHWVSIWLSNSTSWHLGICQGPQNSTVKGQLHFLTHLKHCSHSQNMENLYCSSQDHLWQRREFCRSCTLRVGILTGVTSESVCCTVLNN